MKRTERAGQRQMTIYIPTLDYLRLRMRMLERGASVQVVVAAMITQLLTHAHAQAQQQRMV